jgi:hypothetical protein
VSSIIFILYKYLFSYNRKNKKLIFYLVLITSVSFLLLILVNSFTKGILHMFESTIFKGYGHVYIELEKKMYERQIDKNQFIMTLQAHPLVDKIFIYGVTPSMAKCGNIIVPAYLISYYKNSLKTIFVEDIMQSGDAEVYAGKLFFDKYNSAKYKKLFFPIGENKKKNMLHVITVPLLFGGSLVSAWDEWNEKGIFFPAKKLERFLEKPTLHTINIYLKDINSIDSFISSLEQAKKNSPVKFYYQKSINLLPQYNRFYSLVSLVHIILNSIIFICLAVFIFILLLLYVNNNLADWLHLWYVGISRVQIGSAISLLFFILYLFSFIVALSIGFLIIFFINHYQLIVLGEYNAIPFLCAYDFLFIFRCNTVIILFFWIFSYYIVYRSIKSLPCDS